jgi:hypothetical protein
VERGKLKIPLISKLLATDLKVAFPFLAKEKSSG